MFWLIAILVFAAVNSIGYIILFYLSARQDRKISIVASLFFAFIFATLFMYLIPLAMGGLIAVCFVTLVLAESGFTVLDVHQNFLAAGVGLSFAIIWAAHVHRAETAEAGT